MKNVLVFDTNDHITYCINSPLPEYKGVVWAHRAYSVENARQMFRRLAPELIIVGKDVAWTSALEFLLFLRKGVKFKGVVWAKVEWETDKEPFLGVGYTDVLREAFIVQQAFAFLRGSAC